MGRKYIDKMAFHKYLKKYRETKCERSFEKIGKCFLLIARNYLNKPSFINYSDDWKDDMISEAVFDMVRYMDNYDIDLMEQQLESAGKIPDPFSYFSQYVYNGIMRFLDYKGKDKDVMINIPFIENMDRKESYYE